MNATPDRRAAALAGHRGDAETARAATTSPEPAVRATGLGALERIGVLTDAELTTALHDESPVVRRRAAEISAGHRTIDLVALLDDSDVHVVEMAAWACGEHESPRDAVVERLIELARDADEPLVREAAVAALGAIGDERALDTIIAATTDKPAVRRRAVIALAPFDAPDAIAAITRALDDRDWQVRQAAEDLRRASS